MYLFIFAESPASWCKCASLDRIIIHIYRQSDPKRASIQMEYVNGICKLLMNLASFKSILNK